MHSRTALALVGALVLVAVGALENRSGAPAGPAAAWAQLLPTTTRFQPQPVQTLSLPTQIPTPGLPGGFPSLLSPTPARTATVGRPAGDSGSPAAPAVQPTASAPAPSDASPGASPTAAAAD